MPEVVSTTGPYNSYKIDAANAHKLGIFVEASGNGYFELPRHGVIPGVPGTALAVAATFKAHGCAFDIFTYRSSNAFAGLMG